MSGVWRRGRTSSTSSSTSCSFSPTGAIRRPPPFLAPYAGSVLSAGLRHGTERGRLGRARLSGAGRGDRWDHTRWGEGGRRARREGAVAGRPTAPAARQAGGRSPDSPGLLQGGLHWRFFSVISGTRNPFASFFGDIRHSQSVRLQSQLVTVTNSEIKRRGAEAQFGRIAEARRAASRFSKLWTSCYLGRDCRCSPGFASQGTRRDCASGRWRALRRAGRALVRSF